MNLYDLTTHSLEKCRFDQPDASDRSGNQNKITGWLNEAYHRMCREKLHPWYWEAVTLDANKCFSVSSLSKDFVLLLKVSQYQDYTESAAYGDSPAYDWYKYDNSGTMIVPNATASSTMYVKYEYMPADLGVTYHISGANTTVSIPVDEAISAAEALALVGLSLYLIDVSLGTYKEYTIASATAGVAGAAAIVVTGAPAVATVDGDEIYIGDNWTPVIDSEWHFVLTYWAAAQYFLSQGPNYVGSANEWIGMFDRELGYVTNNEGEAQGIVGAYSPQI